jgi:hypothetical protein
MEQMGIRGGTMKEMDHANGENCVFLVAFFCF